jgi:hypothetical protein
VKKDIINTLIKAGTLTSIIALLVIFFGNTGSGFFSNLMVFVVSVLVGTPFSIIGQKLGGMFAFLGAIFSDNGSLEIFRHIGFGIGALIGVAVGIWIFSNKTEVGFMSSCYKGVGDKKICECIYDNVELYTTKEQIELVTNPNYKNKLIKLYTSCKADDNVVVPRSYTIPNVVTRPTTSVSPARKTKYVDSLPLGVDRFFSKSEIADMGCEAGTVKYEGQCILEIEFLKIMESLEKAPTPKVTASEPSPDLPPRNTAFIPEEELDDLNCPFDNQVMRNGKCVDFMKDFEQSQDKIMKELNEVLVHKEEPIEYKQVVTYNKPVVYQPRRGDLAYYYSESERNEMGCGKGFVRIAGECMRNLDFLRSINGVEEDERYRGLSKQAIMSIFEKDMVEIYKEIEAMNRTTAVTEVTDDDAMYKVIKVASNDTLSVRANAGTRNRKIGDLAYYATGIKVIKCKNAPNGREWCKVSHPSSISGWVRSKYIRKE